MSEIHRCLAAAVAVLLLSQLVAACGAETAAPEDERWGLVAEAVEGSVEGEAARHCRPDGGACQPLVAGEELFAPVVIETEPGGRALLRWGTGAELELGRGSKLALADEEGPVVTPLAGSVTLRLPDAAGTEPPSLQLIDQQAQIVSAPLVAATAVQSQDRAGLTVHRGQLALHDEEGGRVELRAGRSARLVRGHRVDLRAAFSGAMAPVTAARQAAWSEPEVSSRPAGLGRMTARVPGTEQVIEGVRLSSHQVQVTVVDGLARTEVIEEFHNDTSRVLEGRFVFPLPPDASISRLALWVGEELVEGEMLDRKKAARIFKNIVDDSVRPRDPALLEWVRGSEVSLKIFPIMPGQSRRVLLAYNQALPIRGGRVHYRYPLSVGRDNVTRIDHFSIDAVVRDAASQLEDVAVPLYPASMNTTADEITIRYGAEAFAPTADFEFSYRLAGEPGALRATYYQPSAAQHEQLAERVAADADAAYVALRGVARLADDAPLPEFRPRDRAFVVDSSHSQSPDSLQAAFAAVQELLQRMEPDERFVVLACDAACSSFPESGLLPARQAQFDEAARWMETRRNAGASDLAGSLLAAGRRLDGDGQVIYLGDGVVTAGELSAARIGERLAQAGSLSGIDVRLLGVGRSVDEVLLRELAGRAGASYQPLLAGGASAPDIDRLEMALRAPVIERPQLSLPGHMEAAQSGPLPNMALGAEWIALAKIDDEQRTDAGEVVLSGRLDGKPYSMRYALAADEPALSNALVPRLWAERRIASLQHARDPEAIKQVVALSRRHHVLSRHTALLVLENEQMFRSYGIKRTQRPSSSKGQAPSLGLNGIGGLGLRGIGFGGGGIGAPAAAWGRDPSGQLDSSGLGLSGSASSGSGIGAGAGMGFGRLAARRGPRPRVRMGSSNVSGRLSPAVIQRVVRRAFGRLRACYERGLAADPNLRGRVVVSFVIGRDGRVSSVSGSGNMPNGAVRSCVVRSFYRLNFPQPEGGIVTVRYPLVFMPDDASPSRPISRSVRLSWGPSSAIRHGLADDSFRSAGGEALAALAAKLRDKPNSRAAHIAYIRGALARGRFAPALQAAKHFVTLDPDRAEGFELLAYAAAANGDGALASQAMGTRAELAASDATLQQQVARAMDAVGDHGRACAHWRAAAELRPSMQAAKERARQCRAGEPSGTTDSAASRANKLKPGWLRAEIRCEQDASCPTLLMLGPQGRVYSPWTPSAAHADQHTVGVAQWSGGSYRTLLMGAVPPGGAKLTLIAQDVARTFTLPAASQQTPRTVAVTEVPQHYGQWRSVRW